MPKDVRRHSKLLVISDTGMVERNGQIFAFGPVIIELQELLALFDSITWIGFNRPDQIDNTSYMEVNSDKIKTITLKSVGGTSISDKISILKNYPRMIHTILSEIKKHQFIHSRAPSNPAFIAMLLSKRFPEKQFWFKYAGSWVDKTSFFYNLQRKKLKTRGSNCKVTVNGKWKHQPSHILAFENPCLNDDDRKIGKNIVNKKECFNKINFCFVGGLNKNKGIELVLEAFKNINSEKIGRLQIVGDGVLRKSIEGKAKNLPIEIKILGALPKNKVIEIFKESHFIILPSKSEGFPKVIGEAMNYGCIPIVSDISCIGQYVSNKNGFLIKTIDSNELFLKLQESMVLTEDDYQTMIKYNYCLAEKFTYSYYLTKIQQLIFHKN